MIIITLTTHSILCVKIKYKQGLNYYLSSKQVGVEVLSLNLCTLLTAALKTPMHTTSLLLK